MSTHPGVSPVRAVLRCGQTPRGLTWPDLLLARRIGGLPLLQRHLLAFRQAGVRDVRLVVPPGLLPDFDELSALTPAGVALSVVPEGQESGDGGGPLRLGSGQASSAPTDGLVIEQDADVLVDPRLVSQLARLAAAYPGTIVCLDRNHDANAPQAKSPYVVGVPEADEAKPVDAATVADRRLAPIGLGLKRGGGTDALRLDIGRYYWHRVSGPEDVRAATSKILLATMKATDGVFARNNRRVSLRISRLLLNTPVTPNAVTVATLVCGILAGWLMAHGRYWYVVAGSLMAWFASMLDGVDGELARAKFQSSPFGHWLEMACDYVFYIALYVGLGAGLYRVTGEPRWLAMGIASGVGTVLCFAAVAHLKRAYAKQGSIGDFYLAYERTVTAPGSGVFLRITPHLTAFFTRAVFPYFLVLFALLGLAKPALVLMFVSTQSFWIVALVIARMRVKPLRRDEAGGGAAPRGEAIGAAKTE